MCGSRAAVVPHRETSAFLRALKTPLNRLPGGLAAAELLRQLQILLSMLLKASMTSRPALRSSSWFNGPGAASACAARRAGVQQYVPCADWTSWFPCWLAEALASAMGPEISARSVARAPEAAGCLRRWGCEASGGSRSSVRLRLRDGGVGPAPGRPPPRSPGTALSDLAAPDPVLRLWPLAGVPNWRPSSRGRSAAAFAGTNGG